MVSFVLLSSTIQEKCWFMVEMTDCVNLGNETCYFLNADNLLRMSSTNADIGIPIHINTIAVDTMYMVFLPYQP